MFYTLRKCKHVCNVRVCLCFIEKSPLAVCHISQCFALAQFTFSTLAHTHTQTHLQKSINNTQHTRSHMYIHVIIKSICYTEQNVKYLYVCCTNVHHRYHFHLHLNYGNMFNVYFYLFRATTTNAKKNANSMGNLPRIEKINYENISMPY